MRELGLFFIVVCMGLSLPSCFKCRNDDCATDASFSYFVVNESGQNLLQMDSSGYDPDSIDVLRYRNGDLVHSSTTNSESDISFSSIPLTDSIVVLYGSSDKDVFVLSDFEYSTSDCCGVTADNFDVQLNGLDFCTNCATTYWEIQK